VLVLHRLLVTAAAPRSPVELILDLDPASDDPPAVQRAARLVRELLDDLGITGYVKSTGSKGVHVHVPLDGSDSFEIMRGFARDLAREMVRRDPDDLTIEQRKDNRKGRLFVDWLRNSYGQHAVAPYSLRALPGAPVAVPLDWDEATAQDFDPRRYRLSNVFRRLGHKPDPWEGMRRHAHSVSSLARSLHGAGYRLEVVMERSSEHGPRIDEELDRLTSSVTRGAPVESRSEEEREQEGPADDEPVSDAVIESYDVRDAAGDDLELRSELARHVQPHVFPASREDVIDSAQRGRAPAEVLRWLERLPDGQYANFEGVWEALGGEREQRS